MIPMLSYLKRHVMMSTVGIAAFVHSTAANDVSWDFTVKKGVCSGLSFRDFPVNVQVKNPWSLLKFTGKSLNNLWTTREQSLNRLFRDFLWTRLKFTGKSLNIHAKIPEQPVNNPWTMNPWISHKKSWTAPLFHSGRIPNRKQAAATTSTITTRMIQRCSLVKNEAALVARERRRETDDLA